ncbi:M48 family metalloprotease [Pseudoduganella sp. DS3]|uniref:M48 family metalloprotease n=1 Tax=Pseudoduganella guangdongensis TaxID=2692179 RepID=A0A6N9HBW2_9BURK|nr:M48 family metalloprotease [Pseudoduganella guangdongensis]
MQTLAVPELIDVPAPHRQRVLRHWRRMALALLAAGACLAGWQLARPLLAAQLAAAMTPAQEVRLGQGMLRELDIHTLQPSRLPLPQQQRLAGAFASLQAPHEGAPPHRLLFRSGHARAVAFALPSGDIIVDDALVQALPDDAAVLAVLAHELGHLQRRHMLKRLVQEALLPAAAGMVSGDMDWLVARSAALAPQLAWAQQAEVEADAYAADLLEHNGLALRSLQEAPQALHAQDGMHHPHLALHPLSGERLAQLRERAAR